MEPLNTHIATSHGLANFEPRRLQFKVVEPEAWGMGEVFQVDDLLDFSNDDIGGPIGDDCTSLSEHTNDSSLTEAETFTSPWTEKCCTQATDAQHEEIGQPSGVELCLRPPSAQQQDIGQPSGGELCVPPDELADQLEWLSTFVEDSYSSDKSLAPLFSLGPLTLINEKRSDFSNMKDSFQSSSPVSVVEESQNYTRRRCSFSPTMFVPGRARSKRSRTGGRVWSLHSLVPGLTENRDEAPNTVFFETSGDCQGSSSEQEMDDSMRLAKKANKSKQVKKNCDASLPRRCTHCLVQKTPQWRAGPLGAKTLCNACGVRYKSGRLVPEYRPAGSPSFVSEVHSNSHKKILEMRRFKEQEVSQQPESDMSQEVSTQESNTRNSREDIEASIISDVVSNLRTER